MSSLAQRALLLLSGGLDSAALAALLRPRACLFVDYGQACSSAERAAARAVTAELGLLELEELAADCRTVGSGTLAGAGPLTISPSDEWWPFRNQLLLTLAGAWAVERGFEELVLGCVRTDSFHVDGREDFIEAIDGLMRMQEGGLRVSAPALAWSTEELLVRSEAKPGLLGWTHSCHRANLACGRCGGCQKRLSALRSLGVLA